MTIEQSLSQLAQAIEAQTQAIKEMATMYARLNGDKKPAASKPTPSAHGKVGAAPSDIKKGAPAEPPVVEYEKVRHARDANDWTALFKACHNPELDAGFAPVAQALVDAGADVNAPGKVGAAPSDIKKGAPAEPPVVEYEEVRHATTELLAAKGPQAVVGLLAEFGVDHAKKLKPEQYQPYVNAATKLMS